MKAIITTIDEEFKKSRVKQFTRVRRGKLELPANKKEG
jgi:hypothetical protein